MIEEIANGIDAHQFNAEYIFGNGDAATRQLAKVFSFRMIYGGSAYAFFMDSNMPSKPLREWESIREKFYTKYKGLEAWQNKLYTEVCTKGNYSSFTGRWWVFHKEPDFHGVLKYSRPAVCNYIVQGTATGDIVPFAIMIIRKQIIDEGLDAKIICQVHDSLVVDSCTKDTDRVAEIIWTTFNKLPDYISKYWDYNWFVKMTGEVEVGYNYKDLKKMFGKEGRLAYTKELI